MNSGAAEAEAGTVAGERAALAAFELALDLPEGERAAWLNAVHGNDPSLVAAVEALLEADRDATRLLPTAPPATPAPPAPARIGPYRLAGRLGAGGMGEVHLGERDDGLFDHKVAVKLMRPTALSVAAGAFFDTERRALARLRHRHIARLFDGGVTEAGQPYFIMELIEGEPVDAFVRDRRCDVRQVARLVADICEAVQHAHQNLVVHADIKPSNILVDADGEAKLLDFGIAQLAQAGADGEGGFFPRTPAFASPQRMAGARPRPGDDIYALGALLAVLLREGGAEPDTDLDVIAAKAQAGDPARRYPTAMAMADDIGRWLALRPVSARPQSWRYMLGCFVRRNRWPVAATAAAAALLLAGMVAIVLLYLSAERSRVEAERRFEEVRGLARHMLGDFRDALEPLAGASNLRARTAEVGLDYLERLSQTRAPSRELARELAIGYGRVGHALAVTATNATGDLPAGERALARAETDLRRLAAAAPADASLRTELARVLTWRSGVALQRGDRGMARRLLDEALALYDAVLARAPGDLAAAYGRWNAVTGLVDLLGDQGEWTAIVTLLQDNERRVAGLPAPGEFALMRPLLEAGAANAMGDALYYGGRGVAAALPHYRRAIAILDAADGRLPPDVRRTIRTVIYHYQVSGSLQELGRLREALADADRGMALANRLVATDDSQLAARAVDMLIGQRTGILSELGRHGEAIAAAQLLLDRRRRRAVAHPEDASLLYGWLGTYAIMVQVYERASRGADACRVANDGRARYRAAAQRQAMPTIQQRNIAVLDRALARCG